MARRTRQNYSPALKATVAILRLALVPSLPLSSKAIYVPNKIVEKCRQRPLGGF